MLNSTKKPGVENQEWAQATEKAKEVVASVSEMATHAASAVGDLANQAIREVGDKADDLTARAGNGIQELSDRLSKNAPNEGVLGSASQMVVEAINEGGEYLEDAKLSGVTEDIARLIRRNPIPAVLIAIGLGWFMARKVRT